VPSSSHLLAFAVAAFILIQIPGPSLLFTIGRALSVGRRDALLSVLGNSAGVFVQVGAVATGVGAVVATSAQVYTVLKLAGAAYLIWLGVTAIRSRHDLTTALLDGRGRALPTWKVLRTGFTVGVTNPKTIVFFAALLPQFIDAGKGMPGLQMVVLGAIFCAIAIVSDGAWALVAGRARDWFASSPHRLERIGGTGGVMMIGLGAALAVSGRPE
jgi:threonine/homoserine/homoserine lactone efflux protein